jgi:ferredoxin
MENSKLRVNPITCSGHGLCAELLPELIWLDEWGYPVLSDRPVPSRLARQARRAVTDCPALALKLSPAEPERRVVPGRPAALRSEEIQKHRRRAVEAANSSWKYDEHYGESAGQPHRG